MVHTTTPKTITENGAIRKRSPAWNDLKTLFSSVDGENDAPDHSNLSIQNGGQTLQCGFSLDRNDF